MLVIVVNDLLCLIYKLYHGYVCVGKNIYIYIWFGTLCDFRHLLGVLEASPRIRRGLLYSFGNPRMLCGFQICHVHIIPSKETTLQWEIWKAIGLHDSSACTCGDLQRHLYSSEIINFHFYKSFHFGSLVWFRNAIPLILTVALEDIDSGLLKC